MADIYVARQMGPGGFDKIVALKVLRDDASSEEEDFRTMFLEEVRTAALLSHPGIVQTFDAGMLGDQLFMVMEFVSGETLARFDRVVSRRLGRLPTPMITSIAREIADALHYAHTLKDLRGTPLELVHRDISPSNVLISYDGRVKLLDFGVAKVANRLQATKVGVVKGKFAYMSPEQAAGEHVDHRADVYALGVVIWQLLTGKRALVAEGGPAALREACERRLEPPSELGADCDPALDAIVMRATARDPDERYATALELARDLSSHLNESATGYDASDQMRELMTEYFDGRRKRLEDTLQSSEGIDLGAEEETLPTKALRTATAGMLVVKESSALGELPGVEESSRLTNRPRLAHAFLAIPLATAVLAGGWTFWSALDSSSAPVASERTAEERTGSVVLRTTPTHASVVVDGRPHDGATPTVISGLATSELHTIVLSLDGYEPVVTEIDLSESSTLELVVTLSPAGPPADVVEANGPTTEAATTAPSPAARRDRPTATETATTTADQSQEPDEETEVEVNPYLRGAR